MNELDYISRSPKYASEVAPLIYDSAHELMQFIFKNKHNALQSLTKLNQNKLGHFSYLFSNVLLLQGKVVGVEIGFDKKQLKKQEFLGSLALLLQSPVLIWRYLVFVVAPTLDSYIPDPSDDAYYINNIAVSPMFQRQGVGQLLIKNACLKAKQMGLCRLELDVSKDNRQAINFYLKNGFSLVSESITSKLHQAYNLPVLIRMSKSL